MNPDNPCRMSSARNACIRSAVNGASSFNSKPTNFSKYHAGIVLAKSVTLAGQALAWGMIRVEACV